HLGEGAVGWDVCVREIGIRRREAGVRLRMFGVDRDCLAEETDRATEGLLGARIEIGLSAKIGFVCFDGWNVSSRRVLRFPLDAKRAGDGARDVVLNGEEIRVGSIERLSPGALAVSRPDETRVDAKARRRAPNRSLEQLRHVELLADLAWIDGFSLECKR